MKNKAVEAMVRVQFNIPNDNKTVSVVFLASDGGMYEFDVSWIATDVSFQFKIKLPYINPNLTDLSGNVVRR